MAIWKVWLYKAASVEAAFIHFFIATTLIMNILTILLLQSILILSCQSQVVQKKLPAEGFDKYVKSILEDSTDRWKEYPKPPAITNDISPGLLLELSDDSAKYYFEQLSFANMKSNWNYTKALSYFERHQQTYTLLALTAHWNPDTRVSALKSLNVVIKTRPLFNFTKEKQEQLKKNDFNAIKFLVYLLESNPLFINGSENATIHSFYISNIIWNLDLLTNENIADRKPLRDWYKNDLQLEKDILKWKAHLTTNQ